MKAPYVKKGSGTATVAVSKGTFTVTASTGSGDNGKIFLNVNTLTYEAGVFTIDTDGHTATLYAGATTTAKSGSSLVKAGAGTLITAALPPVSTIAVEAGTLALSADCDNAESEAQRTSAINAGLRAFAAKGTWDKLLEPLFDVVKQNFAVRDAKEGETAVASAISALLIAAGGPYYIKREREENGRFYDLSMSPRFDIAPKIAHAALIEMKYMKAGDPAPTPEQLAKIKAEAIDQLDQYSSDPALIAEWHIGVAGVPPVAIHRLVLVFHGGECILNEEV